MSFLNNKSYSKSYSPTNFNEPPNFVVIGSSAVFGLLLIIIVYYIVSTRNSTIRSGNTTQMMRNDISKRDSNTTPTDATGKYAPAKPTEMSVKTVSNKNIKQVFNIKENIYTLQDAPAVCGTLGADLATVNQLIDAHKNGADWCNVGWTKDGLAAYPIQYSTWQTLQDNDPNKRDICGKPGINLARNDPNLLYGVNCYGIKPEPKGNEKVKGTIISDKQAALNAKISELKKQLGAIGVASFNNDQWSQ